MSNSSAALQDRHLVRAADVRVELEGVPTLAEISGRLSGLPASTLRALTTADPEGFAELAKSASDGAAYLRDLATVLEQAAANLKAAAS